VSEAARDRTRLAGLVLAGLFVVMAGRSAYIAATGAPEGAWAARRMAASESELRARILDRNSVLLAESVSSYSLWANPQLIWEPSEVAAKLREVFPDMDTAAITRRLSDQSREFVWVRRGLTPGQRLRIMELGAEGLGFREERRRIYPQGALAGHVLGYTDIDGRGLAGLERQFDSILQPGQPPLRLTLDISIQTALEVELAAAAEAYKIRGGAAILMETRTGAIRGIASWPPFDPHRAGDLPTNDPGRLNRAVGAVYELGSVFKPLTIAAALDAGLVRPDERFPVGEPITIGSFTVQDTHWIGREASLTRIMAESSNIGTVLVNQRLGPRRQAAFLERAGLTARAPVELPGSAAPLLPRAYDETTAATVSYGHGISVTPLSFLTAFAAFGNDGRRVHPTLIEPATADAAGEELMSAETARAVLDMLRASVTHGTGQRADIAGYRIAGKTGTAEKPVAGGYDKDRNITSFAAVFPADRPEFALIVTLDEPQPVAGGSMTAAVNAAPVAGRIVERTAPLLGLTPRFEDLRPPGPSAGELPAERSAL
jgi:cell division protein FtsI (penicillin-binding protein 3)